MPGVRTMNEHGRSYFPIHNELREQFWNTFYHCLVTVSETQKQCIEVARLTALFLDNGYALDDAGNVVPADEESLDLRFLGAVIFA